MAGQIHPYSGGFPTTGSIRQALSLQGVTDAHTGKPYSEAFLMGIAGGAAFGYFIFSYAGHDPQVNLLTRNTFNSYGWDVVVERLGIAQDVVHSTTAEKARSKLVATLESGLVPIVWADVFTLGYEYSEFGDGMWAMQPMVVTSYEPGGETTLVDRVSQPIAVSSDLFEAARGRVKKDKHKMVTLEAPAVKDPASAAMAGLHDCLALFFEKPPKGSASNFGLKGYNRLVSDLQKPESKTGWLTRLPPGKALFSGLTSAYKYGLQFWKDDSHMADRHLFADWLDEAAGILSVDLSAVAAGFRTAGELWKTLGEALLPNDVGILAHARDLLDSRHRGFLRGETGTMLSSIDQELDGLRARAETDIGDPELAARILRQIAAGVEQIRDAETTAFEELRKVLGE